MHAQIDLAHRVASTRAHTATHLLHSQIATLIPSTKQAGSRVGTDELRFDFASERLLTAEEILQIEININHIIAVAATVETRETTQEEAAKLGAKAFFGDKYGSTVRVVMVKQEEIGRNGKKQEGIGLSTSSSPRESEYPSRVEGLGGGNTLSIELCGGTHVTNTKDIGAFVITGQEAVASGIKRITGLTGPKVIQHYHEKTNLLTNLIIKLDVKSDQQLLEKADKLIKDMTAMQDRLTSLETNLITQALSAVTKIPSNGCDAIINLDTIPSLTSIASKSIVAQCKAVFTGQVVVLYKNDGSFAIFSDDPTRSAKKIATDLGIKGGGSDQLVQGKDNTVTNWQLATNK